MKICPFCGKAIDNDLAKFCKYCGKNLSDTVSYNTSSERHSVLTPPSQVASSTDNVISKPKTEASKKTKKTKKWSWLSFLVVICFLTLVVISISDYSDPNSSDNLPVEVEEIIPIIPSDSTLSEKTFGLETDDVGESVNSDDKTRSLIEHSLRQENSSLPMDMGDGMTMTQIVLRGDYVFYTFKCDEDLLDISLIKDFVTKETIVDEFKNNSDKSVQYFLKLCKKAHVGIAFKYVGASSGDSGVIYVPYNDIVINTDN